MDWGFIASTSVFVLLFPITNAYIAIGIDTVLTQIALVGSTFIQIPATIMALYLGYQMYRVVLKDNKVKLPKKGKKTAQAGKYIETK